MISENCSCLEYVVEAIEAKGHTDGHMMLWDHTAKVLVAGDHVVGFGSAVLDHCSGGDMAHYFDTTRALIELE